MRKHSPLKPLGKILPRGFYLYGAFWLLGLLLYLVLLLALWGLNYKDFTQSVSDYAQRPDKLAALRNLLPPSRFDILRGLSLLFLFVFWFLRPKPSQRQTFGEIWQELRLISTQLLAVFREVLFYLSFLTFALPRLILWRYFPALEDELFTWLYFVDSGALVAVSYYPGPNNHVFFSLIASLLSPFSALLLEPLDALRLISLCASLLTGFLLWAWLWRIEGKNTASLGLLIYGFSPALQVYGILGRGYALQSLSVLLLLWATYRVGQLPSSKLAIWLWQIAALLALYTLPTSLYPVLALACFLFYFNLNLAYPTCFRLALVLLILYSPILLLNGDQLFNNSWVKALPSTSFWQEIPTYIYQIADFYLPSLAWLLLSVLGLLLILYIYQFWQKKLSLLPIMSLGLCLFPLLILPFQQVLPFPRVWVWLAIPFSILLAMSCQKLRPTWQYVLMLFLSIGQVAYCLNTLQEPSQNCYEIAARLALKEDVVAAQVPPSSSLRVYLDYIYRSKGRKMIIYEPAANEGNKLLLIKAEKNNKSLDYQLLCKCEGQDILLKTQ